MKIIILSNCRIVLKNKIYENGSLTIKNGKIYSVSSKPNENGIDMKNNIIFPSFIDIQTNGAFGFEYYECDDALIEKISSNMSAHGIGIFYPSIITNTLDNFEKGINTLESYIANKNNNGARIKGINLEGPFISIKYKGIHNEKYIQPKINTKWKKIFENNLIKMITLAPEVVDNDFIMFLLKNKKLISIGHTECTYDRVLEINDLCKSKNSYLNYTHFFNAMPLMNSRNNKLNVTSSWVNYDKNKFYSFIIDGIHNEPRFIKDFILNLDSERVLLVSDAAPPLFLPDGEYNFADIEIIKKGTSIFSKSLPHTIAGSNITLYDTFKILINEFNYDLSFISLLLSLNAARYMGIDNEYGSIEKGKFANFIVLDKNYNIKEHYIHGKKEF